MAQLWRNGSPKIKSPLLDMINCKCFVRSCPGCQAAPASAGEGSHTTLPSPGGAKSSKIDATRTTIARGSGQALVMARADRRADQVLRNLGLPDYVLDRFAAKLQWKQLQRGASEQNT